MNRLPWFALIVFAVGCRPQPAARPAAGPAEGPEPEPGPMPRVVAGPTAAAPATLAEARKGFRTKLVPGRGDKEPVDRPPPGVFDLVRYDSPVGKLPAYLTADPKDGKRHPAVVWITGGDCNSIGDVWSPQPAENDQTASAYRQAGVVMLFPSLRGGNDNPGLKEGFLGEVDDVQAAADFLAKQPAVDPGRIYLGGHSTGGTLALLVAECSDRFRAVFAFGPVDDVGGYGADSGFLPFDVSNRREVRLRSPGHWLDSITSPVFVFEGTDRGNLESLRAMARASKNPKVQFFAVRGATHFSVLAPVNRLIARKVLADDGPHSNLAFAEGELNKLFAR